MSNRFRDLLRKVGSGHHTSEHLTRDESAEAARMMLTQEATPAQIGAFMIAHRIKRPTGEELAGMLDAYAELGPILRAIEAEYPTVVLNSPYDGRSRTVPISPITALVLVTKGCPVIMSGGDRMPTKYGIPFIDIWKALGLDWTACSLQHVQWMFEQTYLGFLYLPNHFPLAQGLVPYRDQLGKRPPQATLELMWCPYEGDALLACGFVHPPTENMIQRAVTFHAPHPFLTVKGLEGSCDLPRDRTCIIGLGTDPMSDENQELEHLLLHPRDYGFAGRDVPLESDAQVIESIQSVLRGDRSELMQSAIWNSGFYLWQGGVCDSLEAGLAEAEAVLSSGAVGHTLELIQVALADCLDNTRNILVGAK